jgi:hypothetical protein
MTCTPTQVIDEVARHFEMEPKVITGQRRDQRAVRPRQVAMFLARKHTFKASYPRLGAKFDRHHTSVLASVRAIERDLRDDPVLRGDIVALERRLGVTESVMKPCEDCSGSGERRELWGTTWCRTCVGSKKVPA